MSERTLAICVLALLVLHTGFRLGVPRKDEPWTAEQTYGLLISLPYLVFVVWLCVEVLS